MRPIVTPDGFDFSIEVIVSCVLVGVVVGIIGIALRAALVAGAFELGDVGRELGGWVGRTLLRWRHRGAPTGPWLCRTCRSMNTAEAERCYRRCGTREELAMPVPDDLIEQVRPSNATAARRR